MRHGFLVVVAAGGEEGAVAAAGPPHARSGFGSGAIELPLPPIPSVCSRAEMSGMYMVIHQIDNNNKIGSFTGIGGV